MFENVLKNGFMAILVSAIVLGTSMPAFAATSAESTEAVYSGANEACMKLCSDLSYDAVNANVDVRTAWVMSNDSYFEDICDGLYAHGECVILQTCIGNGDVRMVIADAK